MITKKVVRLIDNRDYSKKELSGELGISRPALDSKILGKTSWKKLEGFWVNRIYLNLYGKG